jgi:glucose/arabinose dehydrogenase
MMRPPIVATLVLLMLSAHVFGAVEKWSDPAMPVKDGVAIWLDATRQTLAWSENKRELVTGDVLDVFYDASGNRRDFAQSVRDAQPKIVIADQHAAVRFDGTDDHLRLFQRGATFENATVFLVACARSNGGQYRGFLAGNKTGTNDYHTGFNIDMGPFPSDGMTGISFFNIEGNGFLGARNLLKTHAPFEEFHVFTITASENEIAAQANGQEPGRRDRRPTKISAENLILGARCFSNEGTPPYVQGFLDGDIAEMIVYDRALPADQRQAIEKYLVAKYERAADALARVGTTGEPLKMVEKPPDVQMFAPGFTYKKLPVDLTNINNVRYREDGKLVALAYDGNVYLLSDTNGDGLEDQAKLWWDNGKANAAKMEQPIGMALTPPNYPHGRGVFVANKGKLSLLIDTDGDDKLDTEKVAATGWPLSFHGVDALGVAIDPSDQSVCFGVGTTNFADPLLMDKQGVSHYYIKSERGTVMRVAPDLKSRKIIATGVRFSVGMAFNPQGDLFCTDQEGATWVPNGNPLDELLHIQPGRHYGFPARHPKYLPNVIDEPSTFDYGPQHQSTCGLIFNVPVNGGPVFGPEYWRGDAIVTGSSRGKLYRTKLASTPTGYVAANQTIGSLPMLTIDACVSPAGDLVVACHSGAPDWGSGPTGKGSLFKISYAQKQTPQPVAAWQASPSEVHVAFDREIDDARLQKLSKAIQIDSGEYVGAGDRFEVMRPGYAQVVRQIRAPRHKVPVNGVQITPDRRTLIVTTSPQRQAILFGITLDDIDLAYDMCGVAAEWKSSDGTQTWSGWLPHPDLSVSRTFTAGSAEHDALWKLLEQPGKLTMRTSLDLRNMLRPAVQPGSKLDFTLPPEEVTIAFSSGRRR